MPFRLSLVQEADIQSGYSSNSSVGMVLDLSQYFDRGYNLSADVALNNSGPLLNSLQILDAFWCERKNHKKRVINQSFGKKSSEGKHSPLAKMVPNFLDTTPCPMETMARNYLCVRFQV